MNIPTINLARTGTNIVMLRKAAGLTVHDLQMAFGFQFPAGPFTSGKTALRCRL